MHATKKQLKKSIREGNQDKKRTNRESLQEKELKRKRVQQIQAWQAIESGMESDQVGSGEQPSQAWKAIELGLESAQVGPGKRSIWVRRAFTSGLEND